MHVFPERGSAVIRIRTGRRVSASTDTVMFIMGTASQFLHETA